MKISWKDSISARINAGMLVLLVALFAMSGISFWMMDKFNGSTVLVADKLLPELSKSSNLHLAIKDVHRKMDALPHVTSKAGNRVIVQELVSDLKMITVEVDTIRIDKYSALMVKMAQELLPIVNSYSLEVDGYIENRKKIRRQIKQLDTTYLQELENLEDHPTLNSTELNKLYLLARSLPDLATTFLFKNANTRFAKMVIEFNLLDANSHPFTAIVSDPVTGISAIIKHQNEIAVNLSVLQTQTNVIVEQLISISFDRMSLMEKQVEAATQALHDTSSSFSKILFSIVLLTTLFAVFLMYYFRKNVSKRLMLIAKSIGARENSLVLKEEAEGVSELSVIAKSMLRYIIRNEQQKHEIESNAKQLMMIIENSNQAVIIYSEEQVVYCNQYCEKLLNVDSLMNSNIISNDLFVAINTLSYKEKLAIGESYFRFFSTQIDWNGKPSKLALLIDITNEVIKENTLLETLEKATDESMTDKLTGLYNRRKLDQAVKDGLGDNFAVIIADIDWFKLYNDHYGHSSGDLCLVEVAQAIKDNLRDGDDLAIRYGGEEFVLILFNSTLSQAEDIANRIQAAMIDIAIGYSESDLKHLSLSFGITHSDEFIYLNWPDILELADRRLYQAKDTGRAKFVSTAE
jgi:diguanylate cyclase (GGDEF)-like protein